VNRAEKTVDAYLRQITDDVVYEPDGNVPPDFLVAGELAVEVRTLNQNYFGGNAPKGLERDHRRIEHVLHSALRHFDRPVSGQAYLVILRFSRPLGDLKCLKENLRQKLQVFMDNPHETPHEVSLTSGIAITIVKAPKPNRQTFRIGALSDWDSGGFVAGLYIRNIRHCIEDKTAKVSAYKGRYPRWWLVLVDGLSGFSAHDKDDRAELESVRNNLVKSPPWERILVLSPHPGNELIDI
jgi:hypothetical protein